MRLNRLLQHHYKPVWVDSDDHVKVDRLLEGEEGRDTLFALPVVVDARVACDGGGEESRVKVECNVGRGVGSRALLKVDGEPGIETDFCINCNVRLSLLEHFNYFGEEFG